MSAFIPDDEKWINTKKKTLKFNEAIKWAENTNRKDNYLEIEGLIENE
jgi:hypothetical protein